LPRHDGPNDDADGAGATVEDYRVCATPSELEYTGVRVPIQLWHRDNPVGVAMTARHGTPTMTRPRKSW